MCGMLVYVLIHSNHLLFFHTEASLVQYVFILSLHYCVDVDNVTYFGVCEWNVLLILVTLFRKAITFLKVVSANSVIILVHLHVHKLLLVVFLIACDL